MTRAPNYVVLMGAALMTSALTATASGQTGSSAVDGAKEFALSANVSLASQYRFRGIMQTNNKPAIQGGFDVNHTSGFYLGNWNSSISWLDDSDDEVSAPIEMDFYAGYTGGLVGDLSWDVGVLQYYYPGDYPGGYTSPDTTEGYIGLGYGPLTFKYSHAFSNLFGLSDSSHSQYFDLSASVPTGYWGLTVDAHVGYQKVRHLDDASYADWSLGLTKDWGQGFSTSLSYIDTNADRDLYTNSHDRYTGKATVLLALSKSF